MSQGGFDAWKVGGVVIGAIGLAILSFNAGRDNMSDSVEVRVSDRVAEIERALSERHDNELLVRFRAGVEEGAAQARLQAQTEIDQLSQSLSQVESNLVASQSDLHSSASEIAEQRSSLTELEAENSMLRQEVEMLRSELDILENEVGRLSVLLDQQADSSTTDNAATAPSTNAEDAGCVPNGQPISIGRDWWSVSCSGGFAMSVVRFPSSANQYVDLSIDSHVERIPPGTRANFPSGCSVLHISKRPSEAIVQLAC